MEAITNNYRPICRPPGIRPVPTASPTGSGKL